MQQRLPSWLRLLDEEYAGKNPLMICVLKGALMFMADLTWAMKIPLELDLWAVSSYRGIHPFVRVVRILGDFETGIEGRHVVIVEDILTPVYPKEVFGGYYLYRFY